MPRDQISLGFAKAMFLLGPFNRRRALKRKLALHWECPSAGDGAANGDNDPKVTPDMAMSFPHGLSLEPSIRQNWRTVDSELSGECAGESQECFP